MSAKVFIRFKPKSQPNEVLLQLPPEEYYDYLEDENYEEAGTPLHECPSKYTEFSPEDLAWIEVEERSGTGRLIAKFYTNFSDDGRSWLSTHHVNGGDGIILRAKISEEEELIMRARPGLKGLEFEYMGHYRMTSSGDLQRTELQAFRGKDQNTA